MHALQQKTAARKLLTRCLAIIASVYCTAGAEFDSPINVVGYVGGEVVMECIRNSSSEVTWTYIPPEGSDTELSIPGLYRKETSNSGIHRLTLVDLQTTSAGTYVCRSVDKPPAFDRAGAYVVVIAHKPYCENSLTVSEVTARDVVKMACWVHYVATTNVRLQMSWIDPDGRVLATKNFSTIATGTGTSSCSLSVSVRPCPPYLMPHHCAISFHTLTTYKDMAANSPSVTPDRCQSPVVQLPVTPSGAADNCSVSANGSWAANGADANHDLPELQPSNDDSMYYKAAAIGISVAIGIVVTFEVAICIFNRCRRRRCNMQIQAAQRPSRFGGEETNVDEQAMRSTDTELDIVSELCSSPSESSKKPDDNRPPDQPLTPAPVTADDETPAVPDYTNQCTAGPVLAADERTPEQACEDEVSLHPGSEFENSDDDFELGLRSDVDTNSVAASDEDGEHDRMLSNSNT